MFQVWTPVVVKNEAHPMSGAAGVVHAINQEKHPESVVVKFDDGWTEAIDLADLKAL